MSKIAVCGDFVIDEFIYSKSRKLSPEAPVPIADYIKTIFRPGGAANVVANSVAAGCESVLVSRVGSSESIKDVLEGANVPVFDILDFGSQDYEVPIKSRYLVDGIQSVRIDKEKIVSLNWTQSVVDKYIYETKPCDYIVVSDYGKGFYNEIDKLPEGTQEKSIVDPYGTNWTKYKGCFILKPNLSELETYLGHKISISDLGNAAKKVVDEIQPKYLVVTLGAEGVMWTSNGVNLSFYKERARAVADVSGAGDTFVAFLAASLAGGKNIEEAIKAATKASAIAVERVGTAIVYQSEIDIQNKVISQAQIPTLRRTWREENKKVVFTNGCFDIIHAGHISLLSAAKKLGEILVVGVNSDASVKRLKGDNRPINALKDRISVLQAIADIDFIIVFGEEGSDTPLQIILDLVPDVLVKGSDYSEETVIGAEIVRSNGGFVYLHEIVTGLSSTNILKKGAS